MSKMQKINLKFRKVNNLGESDIYRKFSKQFDILYDRKEIITNNEEFKNIYVEDKEFERELKRFRSSILFCVGYTGIGKTTSIRHCFELDINNEDYINSREKELIFATFIGSYPLNEKREFELSARIATMCTKLEEEHPDLLERMRTDQGKEEFYDFMRQYAASSVLENINPVDAIDMNKKELIRMKLKGAYIKNPVEFQASKLKYYIARKYDRYKRLIIILDDIEMFSEEYQEEIIGKFISLQKFMQKTDYSKNREYHVNLIISIQPNMYYVLNSRRLFSVSETVVIKKSLDLNSIFKKRFDYYTKSISCDIESDEDYNSLMSIVDTFKAEYKDIILHLCFFHIREAIAFMARLFANRFWIQGNKRKEDNFTIEILDYNFDNISVYRALGCCENQVFIEDVNSIIPNIFYTTKEEDLSINCLLVLKYFYKRKKDEQYGVYVEKLELIKETWKTIFAEKNTKFIMALEYLFERKVIRKLIKTYADESDCLADESYLYISSRGSELFEMFGRDSVLLEMFREAAWRDYQSRRYFSEQSSSELMGKGEQVSIFKDLLEYIDYLREKEEDILVDLKRRRTRGEYKKAFGADLIVQLLLDGVKKSLKYSEIMNQSDMLIKFEKVQERINESKKKINMD